MYEMLASIVNGGADRIAQFTAITCLEALVELLVKIDEKDFALAISRKFLPSIFFVTFNKQHNI